MNAVGRDEEEQHAAEYFEHAINAFSDDADIEERMCDLRLPVWIHSRMFQFFRVPPFALWLDAFRNR